jgi:hypothetical protein
MKKEQYSPYQIIEIEHWKAFLQSRSMELQDNFKTIINGVKNKSIIADNEIIKISKLEFWHEAHELDFTFELLGERENQIANTFGGKMLFSPNDYVQNPLEFNFIYPDDLNVYYEAYREQKLYEEKFNEFFIWFVKNWIACGGHKIGILATTEENSVRRIFNLNRINWFENIESYYPKENHIIPYPLNRELTSFEIKKRVEFKQFVSKFKTTWRYLENGNDFIEFGIYNYELYKREGNIKDFQILEFDKQKLDRIEVSNKIDKLINQGYFETQRPDKYPMVIPDMIELELYSGSEKPKIQENEIDELEKALNFKTPNSFRFFITKIYTEEILRQICDFPVNDENWRRIEMYLTPEEMIEKYNDSSCKQKNILPIANATEKEILGISLADSSIYIISDETQSKISNSFEDFIQICIGISEYFCPRKYHIEKGNIATIKSWIEKGWDMKDVKTNRSILNLSYNDAINTLLLENGADPNKSHIRYDIVSPNYLQILIDFGLDLEKKFEEDKWLKIKLKERGEFEEILKKYE